MTLETLGLLIAACLAVNLSPGPSVLLASSIGAAQGFRAGFSAVLGMTAGAFVHVLLAASGLAALLSTTPFVFAIVQYLGAAYLVFLGISLLRGRDDESATPVYEGGNSTWRYFRRGLLVDALNPKIALFFLAFIPQFLHAVESPGFLVSVALGSVFLATGVVVNGSIAALAALGAGRASSRYRHWVRYRIPGMVLVLLGFRLLWEGTD